MKTLKRFIVLGVLLCICQNGYAYRGLYGHGHSLDRPIIKEEARDIASRIMLKLIEKGIIPMSWGRSKPSRVEQKYFNEKTEWIITFQNTHIRNPVKQKIYIFVSPTGEYIAANHTGR